MDEHRWWNSNDPTLMLGYLWTEASDRKLRLFAVACCRRVWHLLDDERSRRAVEVAERFADGEATEGERGDAAEAAEQASTHGDSAAAYHAALAAWCAASHAAYYAGDAAHAAAEALAPFDPDAPPDSPWEAEDRAQAGLLHDVFGDPFRTSAFDPSWRTPDALSVATGIYAERAFDRLPILADALEEAGCQERAILAHCRGGGQHARGCWVVDLVLGRQ